MATSPNMVALKFPFGTEVADKVTGIVGVVTGFTTYITGCDQYFINPPVEKEGAYREGHWLDDIRLEATDAVRLDLGPRRPVTGAGQPPTRT